MKVFHTRKHNGIRAELWRGEAAELLSKIEPSSIDLIVTSPPYAMGKEYDRSSSADGFLEEQKKILPLATRALRPGGSLCWQVGSHIRAGRMVPLDALVFAAAQEIKDLVLRNRIVWTFGHGEHCSARFSGRHETILWFTKGDDYHFNLDAVRVRQKYPGKRHYKGPNKGKFSGNPRGKNPGDVWDIPNVKAKHAEKTTHPCQFPVALVQRLIRALAPTGGTILDPYLGSGTAAIAAILEGRHFIGTDIETRYLKLAQARMDDLVLGRLRVRPDIPTRVPIPNEAVAIAPAHFFGSAEEIR